MCVHSSPSPNLLIKLNSMNSLLISEHEIAGCPPSSSSKLFSASFSCHMSSVCLPVQSLALHNQRHSSWPQSCHARLNVTIFISMYTITRTMVKQSLWILQVSNELLAALGTGISGSLLIIAEALLENSITLMSSPST
jgi:hypothetical protein